MFIPIIITALLAGSAGVVGGVFLCLLYLISEKCSEQTWGTVSGLHAKNHQIPRERLKDFIL
jgi:hypothetical protein